MAKIFYRKIKDSEGSYTIDMVPSRWKEAVQALLDQDTTL
jgi:hypothetical protein